MFEGTTNNCHKLVVMSTVAEPLITKATDWDTVIFGIESIVALQPFALDLVVNMHPHVWSHFIVNKYLLFLTLPVYLPFSTFSITCT